MKRPPPMRRFYWLWMTWTSAFPQAAHRPERLFHLEPVVVTASRIDTNMAGAARETFFLDRGRIAAVPAGNAAGLLAYTGVVDLAARGTGAIQADFSVRGSSFEQVLVLLDGVRMNNPQTGHHNANLPVNAPQVERVEVLAGNGSSLYGSAGFGGVVHVMTRRDPGNRLELDVQTGPHRTFWGSASQSFQAGPFSGTIQASRQRSDGYRFDSDYDSRSFVLTSALRLKNGSVSASFRRMKRNFGANGFYADYPSREGTLFRHGRLEFETRFKSGLKMKSRVYVNRHDDDFLLDVLQPDGYRNRHATEVSGASTEAGGRLRGGSRWAFGVEAMSEKMNSSRLGKADRISGGVWHETAFPVSGRTALTAGGRLEMAARRPVLYNPSVGAVVVLARPLEWKMSAGRSFRFPNFTELYYRDPANIGDPGLRPESGWCVETGLTWTPKGRRLGATVFWRNERDRIDWVKNERTDPWRVVNLPRNRVAGASLLFEQSFGNAMSLSASFMELSAPAWNALWSKYLACSIRRQANASLRVSWSRRVSQGVFLLVKKRRNAPAYALIDSKLSCTAKGMTFFISGTNLLNRNFEDFPGIPQPGREFMTGAAASLPGI
jgi:vitamin B12 transporter